MHFKALLVMWIVVFGTTSALSQQPTLSPSKLNACVVRGVEEKLLCGQLEVFENRSLKSGRTIKLNIVVIPAVDSASKETPLFYLDGGPGIAATQNARFFAIEIPDYRRKRDIVLVDQRGTDGSNALNCSPTNSSPQYFLDEMYPIEYVRKCRSEIAKIADPTQYTTEIAMDDLEDVRKWLGYGKINLWGLSYGTRAAQVYMRSYPQSVRSVVLSGALPIDHRMPSRHAPDGQRALDLLLDTCLSDSSCRSAFPDIKQEMRRLIVALRKSPVNVSYHHPRLQGENNLAITADIFAEFIRKRLYSPATSRDVPFIIHRAFMGDLKPFLNAAIPEDGEIRTGSSDGLYLSITCAEDVPFIESLRATRQSVSTIFGNYRVSQQTRACSLWQQGKVSAGFRSPLVSRIPTLILSGRFDPITPPSLGNKIAARLSKSKQVIIPHGSHVDDGLENIECEDKLVLDFLRDGHFRNLKTGCVNEMVPPPFVLN